MNPTLRGYTTGMSSTEISLSSITPDLVHLVQHAGASLIVVRSGERVFAFHDKCPHAFWPLSQGTLRGTILECPGHGWEFDLESGRCLTTPVYCLTPVEVHIDGDSIRLQWPENFAGASGNGSAKKLVACPGPPAAANAV